MFHAIEDRHVINLDMFYLASIAPVTDSKDVVLEFRMKSPDTPSYAIERLPVDGGREKLLAVLRAMARKSPRLVILNDRYLIDAPSIAAMRIVDVRDNTQICSKALCIDFGNASRKTVYIDTKTAKGDRPTDLLAMMEMIAELPDNMIALR